MKKVFLLIGLLISVIIISGCTSFKEKPKYYCDDKRGSCDETLSKCEDMIVTKETVGTTFKYDVTEKTDFCHVVISVERSGSGFKGKSMSCDFPYSKINLLKGDISGMFKYCEGSLKDATYGMFGFG